MSLQWRVFRRIFGLLSLLIIAVCMTAVVFSLSEHRESVKTSFRAQSLFLADQVERLVLWDDRVALKALLSRFVDEQAVVAYAFVKRDNAPYVYTFSDGVPRRLMSLHPMITGVSLKTWQGSTGVFYDIAAPLEHDEAVLHVGLARQEIDSESLSKVWAIGALGLATLLIGLGLSVITAAVITSEVNAATDALRLSEERVRLLLSSAAEGVFGIDLTGRCTFINPAAQRMLGFSDDGAVIGRNMHEIVHHTNADGSPCRPEDCRIQQSARSGRPLHADDEILWRAEKTFFPTELWSHPVEKDGVPVGAVVTFVDITERKEAEKERDRLHQQLSESQKMEALGQLAGGIAHDFNNLLSPIILIVEVLLDDRDPDSDEAKHLTDVLNAARRARQLVHQVLSYSRPQVGEKKPIDLSRIAVDVIGLLRPSVPAGVTLEHAINPDTPMIVGDSAEIHQLILNLATNALQAMDETGGRLKIALRETRIDRPRVFARATLPAGEYVVLEVTDGGRGMDAETRERIFEPFFTTKKGSEGAGLGLAIVDRIVTGHQGIITVTSRDGAGTTFTIYFPRHICNMVEERLETPAPA